MALTLRQHQAGLVAVEILELLRRVLVLLALRILAAAVVVAQVVALTAAMAHKAAPVS